MVCDKILDPTVRYIHDSNWIIFFSLAQTLWHNHFMLFALSSGCSKLISAFEPEVVFALNAFIGFRCDLS